MTRGLRRAFLALSLFLTALLFGGVAGATQLPSLSTVVLPSLAHGFTVIEQGPLGSSSLAGSSALQRLSGAVVTYQRSWENQAKVNEVQDLVVRFSTVADAAAFLTATRHGLHGGAVVASTALATLPGAVRTTYFATVGGRDGVGQAITLRQGDYVLVLSVYSAKQGNPKPVSEAQAIGMASAQQAALTAAESAGTRHPPPPAPPPTTTTTTTTGSSSVLPWVLVGLALGAAAILVHRLRRQSGHRPHGQDRGQTL
jgi:hypothetical protein